MSVVRAGPADDIAALVRGAAGDSVVVWIEPGRDPLSAAIAEASIAPLAIERAPAMRVNAIVADGTDAAAAMAAFLDSAMSTTGQIVRLG